MEKFIYISLACSAISFTITWTSIFEPVRNLVSKLGQKFEQLIHCPWCLNHYIVLIVVIIFYRYDWLQMIMMWFAIVAAGGLVHYVLLRAYKPVLKAAIEREFQKHHNNTR
jgi:hypothetical protein